MSETVIVDYGMANLRSVQKAFEQVGHSATITTDPKRVAAAGKVVLPGVGAFRDAIVRPAPDWLGRHRAAGTSTPVGPSWESASECRCSSPATTRTKVCTPG